MSDSTGGNESGRRGIGASLHSLATNALGLVATHLELIGVELQEEKERIVEIVVLGAIALVMFAMVLMLVTMLVVAALWDSYRLQAMVGVALLYAALGAWALAAIRRKLNAHPNPFAASTEEIAADRERLRS